MFDFDAPLLPDRKLLSALDDAHEQGFREFLSDIGHNGLSRQDKDRASSAVPELEGSLRRSAVPDYDDPYMAAAYMVSYHLEHCLLAYWAFKNLFDKVGIPHTLYVCDVGAGTGAGRVGLLLALNEHPNNVRVYFDAYEPSVTMMQAGNRFWEALRGVGMTKPGLRYRESRACPTALPELPDDALRVVTAFHLSLPYNNSWSPVDNSARESVHSTLNLVSPDAGLFTCHQDKDVVLKIIVDSFSCWDSKSSADFDIPDGPRVKDKSRFYTHAAIELGFDVPGYEIPRVVLGATDSVCLGEFCCFAVPSGTRNCCGASRVVRLQQNTRGSLRRKSVYAESRLSGKNANVNGELKQKNVWNVNVRSKLNEKNVSDRDGLKPNVLQQRYEPRLSANGRKKSVNDKKLWPGFGITWPWAR